MHRNYVAEFFDNVDIKKNLDTEIDAYKRWSLFYVGTIYPPKTAFILSITVPGMYALLPLD